jgi:hypothetical protein
MSLPARTVPYDAALPSPLSQTVFIIIHSLPAVKHSLGGLLSRQAPDNGTTKVHEHYVRPKPPPVPLRGWDYDPGDLADLFGRA